MNLDESLREILEKLRQAPNHRAAGAILEAEREIKALVVEQLPPNKRKMKYVDAIKDVKLYELATFNAGYNQCLGEIRSIFE